MQKRLLIALAAFLAAVPEAPSSAKRMADLVAVVERREPLASLYAAVCAERV